MPDIYNTIQKVEEYWQTIKPQEISDDGYREKWLKQADFLDQVSVLHQTVIFLYDVPLNRFIYMGDQTKVIGNYKPSEFTGETGVAFSFSNIPAEHRKAALLINQKAIRYNIENQSTPFNKVIANLTVLYKKKEGVYFQFLQQTVAVERDEVGHPLLFLSYGYDISHIKSKQTVELIINTPSETLMWNYNFDKDVLEPEKPLFVQEKKVLVLLSEGKNSKDMADILYISPHTADTHRRNLLKKKQIVLILQV